MDVWTDRRMEGGVNGWIEGMGEWMDGGMDGQKLYNQGISSFLSLPLIST